MPCANLPSSISRDSALLTFTARRNVALKYVGYFDSPSSGLTTAAGVTHLPSAQYKCLAQPQTWQTNAHTCTHMHTHARTLTRQGEQPCPAATTQRAPAKSVRRSRGFAHELQSNVVTCLRANMCACACVCVCTRLCVQLSHKHTRTHTHTLSTSLSLSASLLTSLLARLFALRNKVEQRT